MLCPTAVSLERCGRRADSHKNDRQIAAKLDSYVVGKPKMQPKTNYRQTASCFAPTAVLCFLYFENVI